jgi:ribonuclease HI
MKQISIFSDGSSLGNPGAGGYCSILRYKDTEKIVKGGQKNATNNQMELKAVIEGIKLLKQECDITIFSDSRYVVDGISSWIKNWIKKEFKNVKNEDLWREFLEVSKIHKIKTVWVKGHNNHRENEMCDKIAKDEAKRFKYGK